MAGAMRKVGEYLGLVEQAELDEYDDEITGPVPSVREDVPERAPAVRPVASIDERRPRPVRTELREARQSVSERAVTRIETVTPRTYNDARTVGEHYRSGVPVIMNLSEIDSDDAKRLVDFSAGLVFAAHGKITRVTEKVFLLSPHDVDVTDEDRQRIAAGGFFNQS
ncbi:cell division protein SepF [Aeromicrobium sp. Root495]|uniref:cell division protein SepF n=1 Tax=Aeromicrobium sp. Root495 TaxID=1736550 RepID=UPI0006F6DB47|nr:cell division protein SepF [Aeromicrobium sp. Root495]KQY59035.1 cell division protein SepF [Aeromicrobium sp. Root495]